MADRSSTIRFRVDGLQSARSEIERLEGLIRRQTTNFQRAHRVASQKMAGGTEDAGAAASHARSVGQSVAGLQALLNMARRAEEAYRRLNLEMEKQRGIQREGFMVTRAENQMESEMRRRGLAETRAAEEDAKRSKKAAKEKADAQADYHRFVDTQHEAALRKLEQDYRRQRELHRGNTAALEKIDAAYARRKKELMAAGGPGGFGWGSGYKTPAFGAMSDRFTAMFSVGMIAQDLMGDKNAGRAFGMGASGFLLGSPIFGAMNASAIFIGEAIRTYNENVIEAQKATKDYTASLMSLASSWQNVSSSLISITGFGSKMRSFSNDMGQKAMASWQSLEGMGRPGFMDAAGTFFRWLGNPAESLKRTWDLGPWMQRFQMTARQARLYERQSEAASAYGSNERVERMWDMRQASLLSRVTMGAQEEAAGPAGPGRTRRQLERNVLLAQLEQGEQQRQAKQREEVRAAKAGAEQARIIMYGTQQEVIAASESGDKDRLFVARQALAEAKRKYQEALADVARLPKQHGLEDRDARAKADHALRMFEIQQKEADRQADIQNTDQLARTKIQIESKGYAASRRMILQELAEKKRSYEENGQNTGKLIDSYNAKIELLDKQHAENVAETVTNLENQQEQIRNPGMKAELQWKMEEMRLYKAWGAGAREEIGRVKKAFFELDAARREMFVVNTMKQQQIALGTARGTMSPTDAMGAQLLLQNPDMDPRDARMIAEGSSKIASAQFTRQERMRANPWERYKDYRRQVQQAIGNGEMTFGEGNRRILGMAEQLAGPRQAGQYMDAMSYVRHIQSTLSGDASIPKETLDGIRSLLEEIRLLNSRGVTLRG